MFLSKRFLLITGLLTFLIYPSCQTERSDYMSEEQRKELGIAYDSLQDSYKTLLADYESSSDTLPAELRSLYSQMQNMHRQMDTNHRQMMSGVMGRHMEGRNMMSGGMRGHMQGYMTGEWYSQMMGMHQQIALMHENLGHQSAAQMNHRLSESYRNMMKMVPQPDEPTEIPSNEEGDPDLLDVESIYNQNCASCHGSNAQGISGAFPPLVNSKWVTGDKSIPIRIFLHGLQGDIEVQGQNYQGVMPAFKARLSTAEISAVLNYLRKESDGSYSKVSQRDVINAQKTYSNRTSPWDADELMQN